MSHYTILIWLALLINTANPIFYGIHLYRKSDALTHMPQYIWALQDHHQVLPNLTERQRATFIATLEKNILTDALVITEDKFDAAADDAYSQQIVSEFYVPSKESMLCGLSHELRAIGLPVFNAECRLVQGMVIQYIREYAREVQEGTAIASDYATLFAAYDLTVGRFVHEVTSTVTHLRVQLAETPYTPYLDEVATQLTTLLEKLFPQARRAAVQTTDVFTYYQSLSTQAQKIFCEDLAAFSQINIFLVDLHAIAHMHQHPEKKTVILCMGGMHIETILSLIALNGYEQVFSHQVNPELPEFEAVDAATTEAQIAWQRSAYAQPLTKKHFELIQSDRVIFL